MTSLQARVQLFVSACLLTGALQASPLSAEVATGPLRVLASNPRYFADGSGKPVYLAGSHNWSNFVDNGHRQPRAEAPPAVFDYDGYLDFLQARHHNFFRLWRWEAPKWTDVQPPGIIKVAAQQPWARTGPGTAQDGKPKFDLTRFDESYFDRMRSRITAAHDRGIYVSVMLFEGFAAQFTDAWRYHPFNAANNVNGIAGTVMTYFRADSHLTRFVPWRFRRWLETGMQRRIELFQEAYLRKVVDTVNDLDNVLYEVCNEASGRSTGWQYYVIEYVRNYEAAKPKGHPIGMTAQFPGGSNEALFNSPADWVSPNSGTAQESYQDSPPDRYKGKVIVNDTDHLWGHTGGDPVWVWKSFMRGLNVLFMDELLPPPTWQDAARTAMGQTRRWSQRIDLARMTPDGELSVTRYALADRGRQYLVFQPGDKGEFEVDLSGAPATFRVEWFDIRRNRSVEGKAIKGGRKVIFTTPFDGPAGLYLRIV